MLLGNRLSVPACVGIQAGADSHILCSSRLVREGEERENYVLRGASLPFAGRGPPLVGNKRSITTRLQRTPTPQTWAQRKQGRAQPKMAPYQGPAAEGPIR